MNQYTDWDQNWQNVRNPCDTLRRTKFNPVICYIKFDKFSAKAPSKSRIFAKFSSLEADILKIRRFYV